MAKINYKKTFCDHGVVFSKAAGNQIVGKCPFCNRKDHFYVNKDTGLWDCKHCRKSGNVYAFLDRRCTANADLLRGNKAVSLSRDRGISMRTIRKWRVGWDGTCYTIPCNVGGKCIDARRYRIGEKSISTSGCKIWFSGHVTDSDTVWVCEGEWDGMALYEVLRGAGCNDSIVTVPGAGSLPRNYGDMFDDKIVKVVFDNDNAGKDGMIKIGQTLMTCKSIKFINWPDGLPDGYDVRDMYLEHGDKMPSKLDNLMSDSIKGAPLPVAYTEKLDGKSVKYTDVVARYRKHLYLPNAEAINVLYGSVFANRLGGDPLWIFLVAPPGATKTELLMSLSDAPLITTITTLTPHALISGANLSGGTDPSLIPKLNNKVLVVKDFTTILAMQPTRRDEIFGILRDAYDGECEMVFGNGIHRKYKSKFGILAGVTPAIERFSSTHSMLGERFLKYRVRHSKSIKAGEHIVRAAMRSINKETAMRDAMKEIAQECLSYNVSFTPEIPKSTESRIIMLANWVSNLRGVVERERYTQIVEAMPTREVGTRIGKQLGKLSMGIAMFQGKHHVDDDIYQTIVSVAKSTVPDRVEVLVKHLFLRGGDSYASTRELAEWCSLPQTTVLALLQDIQLLNLVQKDGKSKISKWRLSRAMLRLMRPLKLYVTEGEWGHTKKRVRRGCDK